MDSGIGEETRKWQVSPLQRGRTWYQCSLEMEESEKLARK